MGVYGVARLSVGELEVEHFGGGDAIAGSGQGYRAGVKSRRLSGQGEIGGGIGSKCSSFRLHLAQSVSNSAQ